MGVPTSLVGIILISPILLALEGEGLVETRNRVSRVTGMTKKSTKVLGISMKNLNASNQFVPPIAGTLIVFQLVGFYSIFLRGLPVFGPSISKSHGEKFSGILSMNIDAVGLMAEKATEHSRAFVLSARLKGCSFWTAGNLFGPLLHVAGLVATILSTLFLLSQ